ncbi:hypothetical protein BD310DRAFT_986211, partial [Dichomitus squalens]
RQVCVSGYVTARNVVHASLPHALLAWSADGVGWGTLGARLFDLDVEKISLLTNADGSTFSHLYALPYATTSRCLARTTTLIPCIRAEGRITRFAVMSDVSRRSSSALLGFIYSYRYLPCCHLASHVFFDV